MSALRLNFDDFMNLRDAQNRGHLEIVEEYRSLHKHDARPPTMRGRCYRSWKKLQRAGYAEITETVQLVLTSTGHAVATYARESGAGSQAIRHHSEQRCARVRKLQQRRGDQIVSLQGLGVAATNKRSVVFAEWQVGPRPAAVVLQMRAAFVLEHLFRGIYLYIPQE